MLIHAGTMITCPAKHRRRIHARTMLTSMLPAHPLSPYPSPRDDNVRASSTDIVHAGSACRCVHAGTMMMKTVMTVRIVAQPANSEELLRVFRRT